MSTLSAFLSEMKQLGVQLWLENGALKYRAPKGVLTPERIETLKNHKADFIAFFESLLGGPIPHVKPEDDGELSNAQRRLWVLCQLEEGAAAYNIPLHQELCGELDLDVLRRSFEALMQRHESLRTFFPLTDGEPRQQVAAEMPLPFSVADLRGRSDAMDEAKRLGREHARQLFPLESGPLFDVKVLQIEDRRFVLLFTVHHIVADGVSIGVMARDLSMFYDAYLHNRSSALPKLALQYRGYTAWQNTWLQSEAAERAREYWLETLAGELPVLNLPTDYPRPPQQTFDGRELNVKFDRGQYAALQALANESNASLFMLLLAWVGTLLHRYSHQDDIIIGCPFSGRVHPDLEDQVGFYINTVPLRLQTIPDDSFRTLLQQVRGAASKAHEYSYPFDVLVQDLHVERDLSRSPLFDVCLILQNQEDSGLQMDSLEVHSFIEHPGTSKFDLTFCFKVVNGELVLALEYNTRLFKESRIRRMADHLQRLAESLVQNPGCSLAALEMLTSEETSLLLHEWNATDMPLPEEETFLDAFLRNVDNRADRCAVSCGGDTLNYAELNRRADRIATALKQSGVDAEKKIGVYMERTIDLPAVLLGVWKAGCAYVPLDPSFPAERLEFMLQDCDAQALLTQSSLKNDLHCESIATICIDALPNDLSQHTANENHLPKPFDLAYVIYTSGSTGQPKGVCIDHRALLNFLRSMSRQPGFTQDDRLLAVTTISFDIAGLELFLPLMQGGEIVLASRDDAADGMRLLSLIQQTKPTVMQATPATWRMLLEAEWTGDANLAILCGGEALSWDLARRLIPRCRTLWNLYGPTETTIWSCVQCADELEEGTGDANVTIGRPIDNTTVYIVDAKMNPVPVGIAGELLIGGFGLAQCYHRRDDLTAEKYIRHPFSEYVEDRVYRTGDVACWREDGTIDFLGRLDHQVKVRGFRIETGEIESLLCSHAPIRQAVVSPIRSSGDVQLAAYYAGDGQIADAELRDWLRNRLPEYMVPAHFVYLDAFPLTPNGKVDRKALPQPNENRGKTNEPAVPPRNELETRLLALWKETLNDGSLGIHDHFFERGGHSITATRLAYRIQRDLNVEIGLRDLFQYPSVAAMAACIEDRPALAVERIQPIDALHDDGAEDDLDLEPLSEKELELLND